MEIVPTRVVAVTVYNNGALVTRAGSGTGHVQVQGLPLLYASDTLRVRCPAGAVSHVQENVALDVATRASGTRDAHKDEERRLSHAIAALDDEIARHAAVEAAVAGFLPLLPDARAPTPAAPPAALFVDALTFSATSSAAAAAARIRAQAQRTAHVEALNALRRRAAPDDTPPQVARGIAFHVQTEAGAPAPFFVEYFVAAARWVPRYTLHVDGDQALLVMSAAVAQATGEDWSGVRVSVCTADLARSTTLPQLLSWRLGRAQPPPPSGLRPLPTDLPTLFADYDRGPTHSAPAPAPVAPLGGAASLRAEPAAFGSGSSPHDEIDSEIESEDNREDNSEDNSENNEESAEGDARFDDASGSAMELMAAPALDEGPQAPDKEPHAPDKEPQAPPAPAKSALRSMRHEDHASSLAKDMAPAEMMRRRSAPTASASMAKRAQKPAPGGAPSAPPPELPPRYKSAYLRMAGPTEPARGQLLPVDPRVQLEWLLAAHDVSAPDKERAVRVLGRAVAALTDAAARLAREMPAPLMHGSSTHGLALAFDADGTFDVPTDGNVRRIVVHREDNRAQLTHCAVPRESFDVWRLCDVMRGGGPLPTGPVAVYDAGAFSVNTTLATSGPGALQVNLGVDPSVRVVSRTAHVHQQERGLMTQTSRVEHTVTVQIRAARAHATSLVVYDRLPVAPENQKELQVTLTSCVPSAKRTDVDAAGAPLPGALAWRLTVEPGAVVTLAHTYAIDLPAKAELEGGNRREA